MIERDLEDFKEVYPPEEQSVIYHDAPPDIEDRVTIYRNKLDGGAPWILKESSSEVVVYSGLSEEQKAAAHKAIHNAIDEAQPRAGSMFR